MWASILFLTGGLVATLTVIGRDLPLGSVQAKAWGGTLQLFVGYAIFVAAGIWCGWVTPVLARLQAVRLELLEMQADKCVSA